MMYTYKYPKRLFIPVCFWLIAIVFSFPVRGQYEKNESTLARLILNNGNRYDLEVILPGKSVPACRLLLPEHIYAEGLEELSIVHTLAAEWEESGDELQGSLVLDQGVECGLWLKPTSEGVSMKISIKNRSQNTYRNVRVNICAGLSHLPNAINIDWANRDFLPDSVPLDRDLQGKYWYSMVTPKRLKAWTPNKDWIVMHLKPENPEPDSENLYWHALSQTDNSMGCAVISSDGEKLFYQVWKTEHSRHQSPFAGNACMHLIPQVAEELPPGKTATIEGKAGIFEGSWEELAAEFKKFIYP